MVSCGVFVKFDLFNNLLISLKTFKKSQFLYLSKIDLESVILEQ